MPLFSCVSFLAALLLVQVNAQTPDEELSEQYTYNVQLDNEGRFKMFYSYDLNLSILRIAVLVETTGWIGLGISPNGQMPGSDVVMGWVDRSGQAFLQDRYAFARTVPSLDASQDWELKGASEEGGFTTLQFERKLDTCNEDDLPINFGDTTQLIYSFHNEDPVDNEQFTQHQFQGSMVINLFGQQENVPPLPDNVQQFEIRLENVTIPPNETTYYCTLLEIPKNLQKKTHYILKYGAVIPPQSLGHVHHFQVYLCDGMNLTGHPDLGVNRLCNGLAFDIQPCRYGYVLSGWAIGGNDYILPEGVAFPLGGEDKIHTHVLIEIHYDNPDLISGVVDSSGVRYFYTDQPPEHEAGILPVGYNVVGHMIIPPNVERYTVAGYCSANCLNTFVPEEGITVYANLLHTHTVGAEVILRHIRNGVELDPIDFNHNYDFDYQQINFIERVTILPGDELILECVYDSSKRNITTFGGEGARDEMCLTYLHHYPATNVSYCVSQTLTTAYEGWLNTYVPSHQQSAINVAAANNISDARPVFDSLDWTEESYRMFERIGQNGQQFYLCASSVENITLGEVGPPVAVEVPLEQTDNCLNEAENDDSGSTLLYGSVITVVLCWMAAAIM